ncbi:hypothetical protein BDZ90DRAFT_88062 [Jaminaea rosea]|uniref:Uncharacterized protein n=1 Tax=Jaminaea rosea TaxID=1569628 RepID=A0A316UHW5_9BASI|nr:hypothetical protein BDZ90DRAFT_88062 [Jaminaea rosea]PWN24886.1 hypothetical protein BDZ90DRAFT_88062 [Jaminaea rosea]
MTEGALCNFVAGVNSLFGGHRLAAKEPALKGTLRFDDGSACGRQHLESSELVTHPNVDHRLMTTMMASRLHEAFKASSPPASPSAALKAAIMLYMLQEQHRRGGKAASPVVLLSLPLPGVEGVRRSWLKLLPSQGLSWQALPPLLDDDDGVDGDEDEDEEPEKPRKKVKKTPASRVASGSQRRQRSTVKPTSKAGYRKTQPCNPREFYQQFCLTCGSSEVCEMALHGSSCRRCQEKGLTCDAGGRVPAFRGANAPTFRLFREGLHRGRLDPPHDRPDDNGRQIRRVAPAAQSSNAHHHGSSRIVRSRGLGR